MEQSRDHIFSIKNNNAVERDEELVQRHTPWLLNNYEDDVWKLKPHIHSDDNSKYTVNWNIFDTNQYIGIFNRWDYWKSAAKELAYWIMNAPTNKCKTTTSLANFSRSIRELYEWLCFERKCFSLSEVKQEDITSFIEYIASKNLTEGTVLNKLIVISHAYTHREYLSESFTFSPFKSKKVTALAKAYSIENGHTLTLYPQEIFGLLNHALKLVKESKNILHLFDKYMEMHSDNSVAHTSLNVRFHKLMGVKTSEVQMQVRALYGAAITIILILLAERKHELSLTREDDVINMLNNDLDILVGLEMKTAKTITGKKTERAVIQEVKDALNVILELTKYTRVKSGLETILLKLPFGHSANGQGKKSFYLTTNGLYVVLRYFADSAKFNRVEIRPHMFRRAYSMLWTWRYEIGDLEELRLMLKHNSLNFTQKYTDDEEVWEFMGKNEQDLAFDLLNRAFQKKIVVAGKMGKTLERYSRIIQAKSTLLDVMSIADHIDEIIIDTGLRVVAHADGFCFINHTSLQNALCRTEGIGLDPVKRKDSICMNCPNFATDNSRKPYWEKRIELHQEVVELSKNVQLVESSKKFLKKAEKILETIS
ncbi:site-specific integrase [Acinetobacter baumannii]|uniref:site-specific integrase n=1 Tax=Acinetobacter baumannii TaxID=470 RepID=UPI0024B793D9|nr:site-specific integrase [Acinetobacter baumannii]MDI9662793.1 site-specific integrase [Acinetobacter baumannii]MDI9709076.1 site-specific integrase [Acinetobacter baumannii]